MQVSRIGKGEVIGPRFNGPRHEKGHAASVDGISRIGVSDALGNIQKRIIQRERQKAEAKCPLGGSCELSILTFASDDAQPSHVLVRCPREDDSCRERTLTVAQDIGRQVGEVTTAAIDAVEELGPQK